MVGFKFFGVVTKSRVVTLDFKRAKFKLAREQLAVSPEELPQGAPSAGQVLMTRVQGRQCRSGRSQAGGLGCQLG